MRVAIVADDPSEAALLGDWLTLAGHRCRHFSHGGALIRAFDQLALDAVVLDWTLLDVSAADVLRRIRGSDRASLPVLFVSGHRREHDVVRALRQGADDYVVKPVGGAELLARLEAILRRGRHRVEEPAMVELEAYRIDCQNRVVLRDGRPVEMTAKDFELSVLFLRNVGRLLSRGYVMDSVWGTKALISSRTLDTHVSRLRKKLGWTPEWGWRLAAAYGRGYRLDQLRAAQEGTVRHRQVRT
jgi:two-component system, OmpR family, response regulator RegX3